MIFIIISALIFFFYILIILWFNIGWNKIDKFDDTQITTNPVFTSIIVPVRNEEKNIKTILNCLIQQTIDNKNYEIIVSNDHSADNTIDIATSFSNRNIQIVSLNKGSTGKKAAIHNAIKKSKAKLIITLDADCFVGKNWLSVILNYYNKTNAEMIVAPVVMKAKSVFGKMQKIEFMSLIASTVGAIGINKAIMCNGANLIFKKQLYFDYYNLGQTSYESGDDMALMLYAKKNKANKIVFLKSINAIAYTKAKESLNKFVQQRKRWVSKSKSYKDFDVIFVAVIVFLTTLIQVTSLVLSSINIKYLGVFLLIFLMKAIVDYLLVNSVSIFFSKRINIFMFLFIQMCYFFYVIIISILGLSSKYVWKGRKHK